MRSKLLNQSAGAKTWILVFDEDDDVLPILTAFARDHHIRGGRIIGLGGFREVTLGYFDMDRKEYVPIPFSEQVEVMSPVGNIAQQAGETKLHVHAVIGRRDGTAHGGHLMEARVRPTLELFVTDSGAPLERARDAKTGLPLLVP